MDRFNSPDAKVIGVIDHHEDEGLYLDANPRIIQVPTGSCAALVVKQFKKSDSWNSDLAKLMLSAIVLDTGGLVPGGKATPADEDAARFLIPIASSASGFAVGLESDPYKLLQTLTKDLLTRKADVSRLSNRDLLRRDYKQYLYSPPVVSTPAPIPKKTISVGLSTIPVDLKEWVHKDPLAIQEWLKERDLMIHGSLTTFRRIGKSGKAKHRRQQLWVFREDVPDELEAQFWRGMEDSDGLELKKLKDLEKKLGLGALAEGKLRIRAYKQGNAHATRKVTAPLVKQIVEEYLNVL